MSDIEVKALNEFAERLAKLPKTDRGISWQQRNWQGSEELTVYGLTANLCKWLLDNSEAVLSDFDARIRSALVERKAEPVAWVIPGDDNARPDGFIDAMAWQEGEFTRPLYSTPPAAPVTEKGWTGKKCPHCNGHGARADDDGEERRCPACAGTGDEYGCKSIGPEGFFDDQF